VHNKTKAKKKATYLECKWVQGLPEKPRGEEARRGREKRRSFCGRDSVKRENASEREKKMFFIFLNEGQN